MQPIFAKSSGISSLGINLKSFIFQLITFLIVLLILRRYVFPKLVATLEARRKTLEQSLVQAKQTQEALNKAEDKAEGIMAEARTHADEALAQAQKSAKDVIINAEAAAAKRAVLIIKDAEAQLASERAKLAEELKAELADLVADATETIIRQKLDEKHDRQLIEQALKEIG